MYSFFSASFGSQNNRPSLCTSLKQRKFIRNESTGGSLVVFHVVHNYFRLVYIVIQSSEKFIVSMFLFFRHFPFSTFSRLKAIFMLFVTLLGNGIEICYRFNRTLLDAEVFFFVARVVLKTQNQSKDKLISFI